MGFVKAYVAERLTPRIPDLEVRGSSLACRLVCFRLSSPKCINGYQRHIAGGNP